MMPSPVTLFRHRCDVYRRNNNIDSDGFISQEPAILSDATNILCDLQDDGGSNKDMELAGGERSLQNGYLLLSVGTDIEEGDRVVMSWDRNNPTKAFWEVKNIDNLTWDFGCLEAKMVRAKNV